MAAGPMLQLRGIFTAYVIVGSVFAQENPISVGSILDSSRPDSLKWISPNKEFAFGFYNITPTLYLLGVWFDNISEKTLVWTANEGQPLPRGATLQLSDNGFHISISNKLVNPSVARPVNVAEMRDNGNLVLLDDSNQSLWQSFDSPTDTLLPGQSLQMSGVLRSKALTRNYSVVDRYVLAFQWDKNIVIYPVNRMGSESAVWSSDTYTPDNTQSYALKFDSNGFLNFTDNDTVIWSAPETSAGSTNILRRATLSPYGFLGVYVWEKDSWSFEWTSANDPCQIRGQCGINAFCKLDSKNSPYCSCPPGFQFVDKNAHFKGCDRIPEQVQAQLSCAENSRMLQLNNTDWQRNEYSLVRKTDADECRQSCIDDCNCIVAMYYENRDCSQPQMPLLDGRHFSLPEVNTTAFFKVYQGLQVQSTAAPPQFRSKPGRKKLLVVAVSLIACSSIFLLAASSLLVWFYAFLLKSRNVPEQDKLVRGGLQGFMYSEIHAATGGFTEELGRGSYGKVHKGILSNGRPIAAKSLDKLRQEGHAEEEFLTEMSVIGTSHHKNLVQLYGFCVEGSERILVYEYMCNASLDRVLFEAGQFLEWRLRVRIVMGIARGILYLHEETSNPIIHCDIKPQNILLDENYNAKISDFGLAKLMKADQTRTFTGARGTSGYMAPEWSRNLPITPKVDVYSFGMMVLEIICCRKTLKLDCPDDEIVLYRWVYNCMKDGKLGKLVEQQQTSEIDSVQLERMVMVGLWCIQEEEHIRPSIKRVVHMLEGVVEIPPPPLTDHLIPTIN